MERKITTRQWREKDNVIYVSFNRTPEHRNRIRRFTRDMLLAIGAEFAAFAGWINPTITYKDGSKKLESNSRPSNSLPRRIYLVNCAPSHQLV